MSEHPVELPIHSILVSETETSNEHYQVGKNGVVRIEATVKSGLHADIPYVRVWKRKGDEPEFAHSEFCQHSIIGVYFEPETPGTSRD